MQSGIAPKGGPRTIWVDRGLVAFYRRVVSRLPATQDMERVIIWTDRLSIPAAYRLTRMC